MMRNSALRFSIIIQKPFLSHQMNCWFRYPVLIVSYGFNLTGHPFQNAKNKLSPEQGLNKHLTLLFSKYKLLGQRPGRHPAVGRRPRAESACGTDKIYQTAHQASNHCLSDDSSHVPHRAHTHKAWAHAGFKPTQHQR